VSSHPGSMEQEKGKRSRKKNRRGLTKWAGGTERKAFLRTKKSKYIYFFREKPRSRLIKKGRDESKHPDFRGKRDRGGSEHNLLRGEIAEDKRF